MSVVRHSGGITRAGCLVALIAALATPTQAAEPAVPVEAFFRHADMDEVALSPSGRRLALTSSLGRERVALAVYDLEGDPQPRLAARFSDADVFSFQWVNDDLMVFDLADRTLGGGDQRRAPGLFSVRADGTEMRPLVRMRDDFIVAGRVDEKVLDWDHSLLQVPQTGGSSVIVGRRVRNSTRDLQEILPITLDVRTSQTRTLSLGAPADSRYWWFDATGRAWLVASVRDGRTTFHWRAEENGPWKAIASADSLNVPFWPHAVDSSGQLFVTASRGAAGYSALYRFDFASGRPENEPLVSTPGFDFAGQLVGSHGDGRTLGVRTTTDAELTVWFDPRLKQLQAEVDARLPGRVNRMSCRRCTADDPVVLVRSWSDRHPGEYWVYRPKGERWQRVGGVRDAIDPRRMGTLDLHRIKARDGLEMPVWVTQPAGPPQRQRPAVVLVHGGPWLRGEHWHWNAMAQFLASRGYVVIAPEFRGSAGYGRRHERAGWKQWGLAMQDDVADALAWAVGQGWVDPARVCIAGGSYGGYATLMGLARHPQAYRCGVAWAGVTDPRLMFGLHWINDISQEHQRHSLPAMLGDPKADAAQLAATAPVDLAGRIKAPVLLAHGARDSRVPLEHGERMRDALREAGNPPEWVLYPDEAHGWFKEGTRIDFARRMEAFLAQHLK